jgi:hypothetical protein
VPCIFKKVKSLPLLLAVSVAVSFPGVGQSLDLRRAGIRYQTLADAQLFDSLFEAVHRSAISAQTSGEIIEPTFDVFDVNDYVPKGATAQATDATRKWVLEQLHEAVSPPRDLSRISSMLYGLVSDRRVAEQPDTRKALAELDTRVRALDQQAMGCGDLVSLRFISSFLDMAEIPFDTGGLDKRLYECLSEMNPFDRACALFSLCRFPSDSAPREKLSQAVKSIEDLQQADGSFGSYYGLQRYYLTTHAVFALHSCNGTPDVVRRGQVYLRNGLPGIKQAGFLDGLLESLLMLRKMGVEIPNQRHYTDYLRSRIKENGSICFFDRPACRSDGHATSLLLEFLREFND